MQYCMRPLPHGLFLICEKSNGSNENTLNRIDFDTVHTIP